MPHEKLHIQKLLEGRYYLRDENGNLLETEPDAMFSRVAGAIAKVENTNWQSWADKFYLLMRDNKFLPNTPTLINAGKKQGVYAACNVLEIPDSMNGIFDILKDAAIISKYGGGLGLYFGNLREEGAVVKSTGQTSSGPVSFMEVFDAMCNTVKQGGSRRGAMLAGLPVWHPDIRKFISCKDDGKFSNFNISVIVTDEFMKAVENNQVFYLHSPGNDFPLEQVDALDLWNEIIEHAHKTGDPGLIFIDEVNRKHPLEEEVKCCNACGEQTLLHGESCVLGSINLMAYLREDKMDNTYMKENISYPTEWNFDWDKLGEDIPTMVRFLDDVIDASPYPLQGVEKATKASRKIGLGIMGWADCLIKMKIPYGSQISLDLAEELMDFIYEKANMTSIKLGEEKGFFPLSDNYPIEGKPDQYRRNATLLTVAPTGTLSRIAGVSSGIEPIFAWRTHHKLEGHEYDEEHWAYASWRKPIEMMHGNEIFPAHMKTANEIAPELHLRMQAAFQRHVDSSISKTINLANNATIADVENIYYNAWKLNLKGITIYRDGSKEYQPLNKIEEESKKDFLDLSSIGDTHMFSVENKVEMENHSMDNISKKELKKRGPVAVGVTHKVDTGRGKIYITINYSEYHSTPVEVFIRLGHLSTPTESALAEWSGRLISLLLKYNVPLENIVKQGNKVYGDTVFWYNNQSFCSFPKLISHLLNFTFEEAMNMAEMDFESMMENGDEYYEEKDEDFLIDTKEEQFYSYCYNCGTWSMVAEGGCKVCQNCGFEQCG